MGFDKVWRRRFRRSLAKNDPETKASSLHFEDILRKHATFREFSSGAKSSYLIKHAIEKGLLDKMNFLQAAKAIQGWGSHTVKERNMARAMRFIGITGSFSLDDFNSTFVQIEKELQHMFSNSFLYSKEFKEFAGDLLTQQQDLFASGDIEDIPLAFNCKYGPEHATKDGSGSKCQTCSSSQYLVTTRKEFNERIAEGRCVMIRSDDPKMVIAYRQSRLRPGLRLLHS